jgi:hypothetical protein
MGVKLCDTLRIKIQNSVPLGLQKHSKNSVRPVVPSTKATFNISEVSVAFFHSLKHNLLQKSHFFQVRHFLCTPKLPVEQHTFIFKQDTAQQSEVS